MYPQRLKSTVLGYHYEKLVCYSQGQGYLLRLQELNSEHRQRP
jgi:hypothetical protein